jgi:hypothetical protein
VLESGKGEESESLCCLRLIGKLFVSLRAACAAHSAAARSRAEDQVQPASNTRGLKTKHMFNPTPSQSTDAVCGCMQLLCKPSKKQTGKSSSGSRVLGGIVMMALLFRSSDWGSV